MNCKVSVVMSIYNEKEEWLRKSIDSILGQSFDEFEFIIVLDNPQNSTARKLLEEYEKKDDRIKVLYNEKNCGLVYSLNKALKVCNGEYIARMDADDVSDINRFKVQCEYLDNNDVDLVASYITRISENNEILPSEKPIDYTADEKKYRQFFENYIPHPTWMFKKEILKTLEQYRDVPLAEDYDFTCRALMMGYKIKVIPKSLLLYRIRDNGISQSNYFKQYCIAKTIAKSYRSFVTRGKKYNPYTRISKIISSNNHNRIYRFFVYRYNHMLERMLTRKFKNSK